MTVAARTTIYLVRHGETEWNQERPGYCGWTDIPLNARGRLQADALGQRFTHVPLARVLSSDMVRARHTAEVIAASSGSSDVETDPRFRELNYGQWEGLDSPELAESDALRFEAWQRDPGGVAPPGGETHQELLRRTVAAVEEHAGRSPGESILVVSHKTAILGLLCWALDVPLDRVQRMLQQNAAVNMLQIDGDRRWVGLLNDTSHLPEELISPAR